MQNGFWKDFKMIIGHPTILSQGTKAILTAKISSSHGNHELFYALPAGFSDWFTTERSDGFVAGVLFQAMSLNEDIRTEAPVSSRLFHSLQGFFIPMMTQAFPSLHEIRILPASLVEDPAPGTGVATGFSGGIDSFASVIQHWERETSSSHKVSHLLYHNVGSHSTGDHGAARRLFNQRYEELKPFAEEAGIPFIPVDSNVSEIFPIDFIRMHPALNASIPLVLQNQFQRYYYASTYKYSDCGVNMADDVARFDPLAFHLFSTEGFDSVSTGGQMSRVEKTQMIADFEPSFRYLNVCVDPAYEGRNCSVCFKCCRTLMTLELLGISEKYNAVFNLDHFRRVRNRYLLKCLRAKSGSFEAEIAALFREKGKGPLRMAFRAAQLLNWA
jgi:hypothetical protein